MLPGDQPWMNAKRRESPCRLPAGCLEESFCIVESDVVAALGFGRPAL